MECSEALRATIKELKITPAHLAVAGGVSETMIRRYMSGRAYPGYKTLMRLRREYPVFAAHIDRIAE